MTLNEYKELTVAEQDAEIYHLELAYAFTDRAARELDSEVMLTQAIKLIQYLNIAYCWYKGEIK